MKKIAVIATVFLVCAACDFFLHFDSKGLKVEIGDNDSDNNTNNTNAVFYVYALGEASPFGIIEDGGTFIYSSGGGRKASSSINGADVTSAAMQSPSGEVEIRFTDICSGGLPSEAAADFSEREDILLAACDLSRCAPDGFDIFAYAERNGFDAYCSAE